MADPTINEMINSITNTQKNGEVIFSGNMVVDADTGVKFSQHMRNAKWHVCKADHAGMILVSTSTGGNRWIDPKALGITLTPLDPDNLDDAIELDDDGSLIIKDDDPKDRVEKKPAEDTDENDNDDTGCNCHHDHHPHHPHHPHDYDDYHHHPHHVHPEPYWCRYDKEFQCYRNPHVAECSPFDCPHYNKHHEHCYCDY